MADNAGSVKLREELLASALEAADDVDGTALRHDEWLAARTKAAFSVVWPEIEKLIEIIKIIDLSSAQEWGEDPGTMVFPRDPELEAVYRRIFDG